MNVITNGGLRIEAERLYDENEHLKKENAKLRDAMFSNAKRHTLHHMDEDKTGLSIEAMTASWHGWRRMMGDVLEIRVIEEIDFEDLEEAIDDGRKYVKLKSRDEPYEVDEDTYEKVLAWITEMNAKRKEPKPCPFCGSNDLYIVEHMIGRDAPFMSVDDKTVGIFCNTCKQTVTLEANEDEGRDFSTEQRAIAAWNRRAK